MADHLHDIIVQQNIPDVFGDTAITGMGACFSLASGHVANAFDAPRTDRHMVGGTVTIDGSLVERPVALFSRLNMEFIAATWSHPDTGQWLITGVPEHPERSLFCLALGTTGNYNAEVADFISQASADEANEANEEQ